MPVKEILWKASVFSVFLPLIIGLLCIRRMHKDSIIIFILVMIATPPQLFSFFQIPKEVKFISYNLYTPIEFTGVYFLLGNRLNRRYPLKLNPFIAAVYFSCCAALFYLIGISNRFINELVCLSNFIYLLWMLLYIKSQFTFPDEAFGPERSFFWYFNGLLIYAPCTMVVFALYHYLRNHSDSILQSLWIIHSICNILMYMLFSIGLFYELKPQGRLKPNSVS
jgi:hypothetical protein